jgi:dolichol-phosphate mannosyltransferase
VEHYSGKNFCVGMPLFNEESYIYELLANFENFIKSNKLNIDLVIFDDCSTDNSYEILLNNQKKYQFLKVYKNNYNLKHGPTIYNVYKKIAELGYDYIIGCDSDGQFDLNDIPKLLNNYESQKLLIGSRTRRVEGGIRLFISKLLKQFINIFFNLKINDSNSPLRLFAVSDFQDFEKTVTSTNLRITNILLSIFFLKRKKGIVEVPINHFERASGGSGTMWEANIFKNISIYLIKFAILSLFDIWKYKKNIYR